MKIVFISILCLVVAAGACAKAPHRAGAKPQVLELATEELVALARDSARQSMEFSNRTKAKELAEHGIGYAKRCILAAPNEAGCYYWRAINTGLYYRLHVIGYQRGVKQMIEDCKKVIELDPAYDYAGAYRVLGGIYTQLPQTGGTAESITRDLDLAEKYLREAVNIAPDYPENHLALAETLLEKEETTAARVELTMAQELAPSWKHDVAYRDWQKTISQLGEKLRKLKKK